MRLPAVHRSIDDWYSRGGAHSLAIFLLLFVIAWTAFHAVTYSTIGLHPDLTEIYAWSRHPALGYYKHPPLGGLMAAAWFAVMPAADWSFHLFAMVNCAAALWATWLIARRYLSSDRALFAVLLLLLLPFYQFHGQRFASNQTLLATWPFAVYFFLRAFETRALGWSIAAGLMAGVAMLGKYYSIHLVAGIVLAALTHPGRGRYLASLSPWVSALAGALVLAPHVWWLRETGFQPFDYAYSVHGSPSLLEILESVVAYLLGCAGYILLPVAVYWLAVRPSRGTWREAWWPDEPARRMLVVMFATFILLPALSAPFFHVTVNSLWSMPAYFLVPVILLAPKRAALTVRAKTGLAVALAIFTLGALAVAPYLAWQNFQKSGNDERAYTEALSADAGRLWREVIGRPPTIIIGDNQLSASMTFYDPAHPDSVPFFNLAYAPWVSAARLAQEGFVALCRAEDTTCVENVQRLSTAEPRTRRATLTVLPRHFGRDGTPERFMVQIVPPRATVSRPLSLAGMP